MTREVTERDFRMPEYRDADPADYEFRDDGKLVRKDRWQTGVCRIAALVKGPRWAFEIDEVVDQVRAVLARRNVADAQLTHLVHALRHLADPSHPSHRGLRGEWQDIAQKALFGRTLSDDEWIDGNGERRGVDAMIRRFGLADFWRSEVEGQRDRLSAVKARLAEVAAPTGGGADEAPSA